MIDTTKTDPFELIYASSLGPSCKLAYVRLYMLAGGHSRDIRINLRLDLVDAFQRDERSARRWMTELSDHGLIEFTALGGKEYHVTVFAPVPPVEKRRLNQKTMKKARSKQRNLPFEEHPQNGGAAENAARRKTPHGGKRRTAENAATSPLEELVTRKRRENRIDESSQTPPIGGAAENAARRKTPRSLNINIKRNTKDKSLTLREGPAKIAELGLEEAFESGAVGLACDMDQFQEGFENVVKMIQKKIPLMKGRSSYVARKAARLVSDEGVPLSEVSKWLSCVEEKKLGGLDAVKFFHKCVNNEANARGVDFRKGK